MKEKARIDCNERIAQKKWLQRKEEKERVTTDPEMKQCDAVDKERGSREGEDGIGLNVKSAKKKRNKIASQPDSNHNK